ncbi:GNAT family N-acetyltransferase [Brevundimonas sp.]|uniref:GNAT family N-acetyltransferase n=1 Tax=Brevundimonas sp. TaxID=1871086 RepID=UPI0025C6D792|nr:GNAT family N-acetyltransferase [Brevundimonas sp.]
MTTIRTYRDGDAPAMADVYGRAVRAIGARDYSPKQVEVWAGQGPTAKRFAARMADGRRCWVATDDAGPVMAFVDLEADGHIDFLYADPDVAGRGVAGALLDELEVAAAADGMTRLYVEASEAARRFFLKRGYAVIERRDFEVAGVAIHNYAMERRL